MMNIETSINIHFNYSNITFLTILSVEEKASSSSSSSEEEDPEKIRQRKGTGTQCFTVYT